MRGIIIELRLEMKEEIIFSKKDDRMELRVTEAQEEWTYII